MGFGEVDGAVLLGVDAGAGAIADVGDGGDVAIAVGAGMGGGPGVGMGAGVAVAMVVGMDDGVSARMGVPAGVGVGTGVGVGGGEALTVNSGEPPTGCSTLSESLHSPTDGATCVTTYDFRERAYGDGEYHVMVDWEGVPYSYRKVHVQDGAKKRPKLEGDPPADAVRRVFDVVLQGSSTLDVASHRGKPWFKTSVRNVLLNEPHGHAGLGNHRQDGGPPVRVEGAHPPP